MRHVTEYFAAETAEYRILPKFLKLRVLRKRFEGLLTQQPPFGAKMDLTCCSKRCFPRATLSETVRFSEQVMSADKYPSIFCTKWRLALLCLLDIFKYFSRQAQF